MNLLEVLKVQHEMILQQLRYLENLSRRCDSHLEIGSSLRCVVSAVRWHAGIEEKFLFPKLRSRFPEAATRRRILKFEHREILKVIKRLEHNPSSAALETAKFITFLRDHIKKEECVAFPQAMKVLGVKKLQNLEGVRLKNKRRSL